MAGSRAGPLRWCPIGGARSTCLRAKTALPAVVEPAAPSRRARKGENAMDNEASRRPIGAGARNNRRDTRMVGRALRVDGHGQSVSTVRRPPFARLLPDVPPLSPKERRRRSRLPEDTLCVEYEKRDITVTNGGAVDFSRRRAGALRDPRSRSAAIGKQDHWRVQGQPTDPASSGGTAATGSIKGRV